MCRVFVSSIYISQGYTTETMAEQQVNLTDLDPAQLQEVKKQLDSVSPTTDTTQQGARANGDAGA